MDKFVNWDDKVPFDPLSGITDTSPFYLFIHIHKTAGTTLRGIVDCQFGQDNVLTYYNQTNQHLLDNLDSLLKIGYKKYKALIGHFHYGVHDKLDRPAKYISFVRNPVALAISAYYENLKTRASAFSHPDGSIMSLEYCIEHMSNRFSNQQIKMLGGFSGNEVLSKEHLDLTLEKMEETFEFIGVTERFAESILLCSKLIGWCPCTFPNMNVRHASIGVSDLAIEKLTELNALDQALYDHITRKFTSQVKEEGEALAVALVTLMKKNKINFPKDNPQKESAVILESGAGRIQEYLDSPKTQKSTSLPVYSN